MRIDKLFRTFAPVIAMGLAAGLSGCDNVNFSVNGEEGVPLADLDLTGEAPSEVALMGPDTVVLTTGETLAITVDGNDTARDRMRFVLKDGTLGITRAEGSPGGGETAQVNVTMPSPQKIVIAGSGTLRGDALSGEAEVAILGSGLAEIARIAATSLEVDILGSGTLRGAGEAETLDLTVGGSGSAALDELQVGSADIDVLGSGNTAFRSDGEVKADIMGSGDVTVRGSATCTVSSMGSGKLRCERAATEE